MNSYGIILLMALFAFSCGHKNQKDPGAAAKKDSIVTAPKVAIPLTRESVSKDPVASYKLKTENPLNDWYFRVNIYETSKTFHYLMKMEYEEIRGRDTLHIPNLGIDPKPVIRKGPEQYSVIVGFMDKNNEFKEYKKVYVKNNVLKVTTLKHYAVTRRLVEQ